MDHGAGPTSPECRAGNDAWLTTLACCVQERCGGAPKSKLERFWEEFCTGDAGVPPKWDYSAALSRISQKPDEELAEDEHLLNGTYLVNSYVYESQLNTLSAVYRENKVEATFGIILLVTGFALPILLTFLSHVPLLNTLIPRIKPYLIYPSIIRRYSIQPLPYLLGNAPTLGQAMYISVFIVLNIILSAVNYEIKQPHAWYATSSKEITAYIFYRTGVFSFVCLPLLILFSSRNNILLWATNWSHSTFLLLHRWVARLFFLYALLHTLLALPLYYPDQAREEYWIWGAVAIVAAALILISSVLYARRYAYEAFLISHILLTIFVIAGCWYHIQYWIGLTWGYETWLYAACAVWFSDRMLRLGRILKNGIRRAEVTEVGEDYVRVDIDGPRWAPMPGKHMYAYFPTLNRLRPWESHPFSMIPTHLLVASTPVAESNHDNEVGTEDIEKHASGRKTRALQNKSQKSAASLTFFIKKSTGMTKYFQATSSMITLLEGPYSNNSTADILRCDRLLLIGGGIGITGLISWIECHPNVKLYWGMKTRAQCLATSLAGVLASVEEKEIRIGSRLDIEDLIAEEERSNYSRVGVVVSGPGSLCDDVRAIVSAAGRKSRTVFELEVDAYSW